MSSLLGFPPVADAFATDTHPGTLAEHFVAKFQDSRAGIFTS